MIANIKAATALSWSFSCCDIKCESV